MISFQESREFIRIKELEEEVRQLKEIAFGKPHERLATVFRLTEFQGRLLALLVQRESAHREVIVSALWGHRDTWPADTDKTIQVHVHNLRRKLPGWASIESVWGMGYRLDAQARRRMKAIVSGEPDPGHSEAGQAKGGDA